MERIKSVNWYEWLFRLGLILLVSMALPGTYVYHRALGPDEFAVMSGSYILASWNPATYLAFGFGLGGLICAWLARKFRKRVFSMLTAGFIGVVLWMMFGWCGVQHMVPEYPLMLVPPLLGWVTVLAFLISLLKR